MRTVALLLAGLLVAGLRLPAADTPVPSAAELARTHLAVHRFSTLFTAQDVRKSLSTDDGIAAALAWCRDTGVTKVYVETFRDGYQVDRAVLEKARDALRAGGLEVSGCVTTTHVGKKSNRWNVIACYTDAATQDRLQGIFEFAAGLFDEVMIDDFWFTDCSCPECDAARIARQVKVGGRVTAPAGDTWEEYRRELMLRLSSERILAPAKQVNPRCRLIIKYPQWYDVFHERGYDVDGETRRFDRIWVGTETRDYADPQWGGTVQYEAFFLMRWLGGVGGSKCGGGWFDWLGTTERTYVEQARETILGGARESLLFCYGGLQGTTGPKNVAALRAELPDLFRAAAEVSHRELAGVAAYKPMNSPAGAEKRVFDFVGMLGLPLVPTHLFPSNAPAAFFSAHALADAGFAAKFAEYVASGRPVLVTDAVTRGLPESTWKGRSNVVALLVKGNPKTLLELPPGTLATVRDRMLAPWKISLRGPNRVALCLFADGSTVLRNFNDTEAVVELADRRETIPARGWRQDWR